jgi:hypothetical protein
VYHGKDSGSSESGSDSGDEGTEDLDESTGPNETVFLVYLYVSVFQTESKLMLAFCSRWKNSGEKYCSYSTLSKR